MSTILRCSYGKDLKDCDISYPNAHSCSQRSHELESSKSSDLTYATGFGSGLLAAAAVSCYPTPDQLLPVALETILISFRVGLLAANFREQIVGDKTSSAPWCVKVQTDKAELVLSQLEEFVTRKVELSRPFTVPS